MHRTSMIIYKVLQVILIISLEITYNLQLITFGNCLRLELIDIFTAQKGSKYM